MNTYTPEQEAILNRYTGGVHNWTPEQSKQVGIMAKDAGVSALSGVMKLPADVMHLAALGIPFESISTGLNNLANDYESGIDFVKDKLLSDEAVKQYYATKNYYENNGIFSNPTKDNINPIYNWYELAGGIKFATKGINKGLAVLNKGNKSDFLFKAKQIAKNTLKGRNATVNETLITGAGIYNDYYINKEGN